MELSADELLYKQRDLGGKISRISENLKKSVAQAKMTKADVTARIERLDAYMLAFEKNHDILMFRHTDNIKDSDYFKSKWADTIEEAFIQQKAKLLEMMTPFNERKARASEKESAASSRGESPTKMAPLPRVQLPEFSGEYVKWPAFKDLFKSIVERNNSLSSVDRLHYLKSCLKGQAADFVSELPTTHENYDRAWAILMEQYENKRILVRACLDRLASLPKMTANTSEEVTKVQKGVASVTHTLESLGRPIDKTEDWFVYSVVNLFEPTTRSKWEEQVGLSPEPPTFAVLKDFMTRRRHQLESSPEPMLVVAAPEKRVGYSKWQESTSNAASNKLRERKQTARVNHAERDNKVACTKCHKEHFLMQCPDFKSLHPRDRRKQVEKMNLCFNCLGRHSVASCPSTRGCMACGERHHSLLHDAFRDDTAQRKTAHHSLDCQNVTGKVLLATAMILISDSFGRQHQVRALIDQGSEISMLTEGLAQRLQLPRTAAKLEIFGVGGQQLAKARGRVTMSISGKGTDDTIKVTAIVLPKLTNYSHSCTGHQQRWKHLQGLELADPTPSRSSPIEVLLGADVYPAIIKTGVRKGSANDPVGQLTIFGWIITGVAGSTATLAHAQVHQTVVGDSLGSLVRRFWEQEDMPDTRSALTPEEVECENHFVTTHSRTPEGRYQVRLPFRQSGPMTTGSRAASWHSLRRMELRFKRDEGFKNLYQDFISEYEQLGHMTLTSQQPEEHVHYLPHHGVLKPSSTTTKLRVVFNGSWSEPAQRSLNDCLHAGPNSLPLLADVLLRWRRHQFVVTADVTKMYRQILVHPEDRDYQRILWRSTDTQHVSEYKLNTVTYGLSCAPFLAVRTMRQLADDEQAQYPIGSTALKHDAYVDDILTGADSIPALKETATQLHQLCKAGGFPLQKWASNVGDLHDALPQTWENATIQPTPHQGNEQERKTWTDTTQSTLGLQWSPREDTFQYIIPKAEAKPLTKRSVISQAAQLYDPLGWLTPVVVRAKIMIQSTWLLGLDWDEELPTALAKEWSIFCAELQLLEKVRIPRPLFRSSSSTQREFHGFADASERAYGAVIYLRTRYTEEQWTTSLVTAKSKVAPLQQVSLPRLELCAAHLLARLMQHTATTLNLSDTSIHLWSDSTVALGWVKAHPSRWRTYVANRVADIQRRVPEAQWHHVPGVENPADCASRGISPSQLLDWDLWWKGPAFLKHEITHNKTEPINEEQLPEERGPTVAVASREGRASEENEFLNRFSSYDRLLRITAWCLRWRKGCHNPAATRTTNTRAREQAQLPILTPVDILEAERCWIRLAQREAYGEEIRLISTNQCVPSKSSLAPLLPSLDNNELLRVGGRLSKAFLNPDEAHPVILPPKSRVTQLYVSAIHRSALHGGVQATLGAVRQRFWIPQGRSTVKAILNKCITCLRWRAAPAKQLMGELPEHRITPARPFHSTGVDYAGPFWLRTTPGRGHKAYKGFLAVFICMATRAVHLEVVTSYSTEAFLAAFRRFTSRRGICAHLYSDCGTNFQGADRELRRLFTASSLENRSLRIQMTTLRTQWHFNPPGAPHFGGLWEAAVKSIKYHLRRVIGETRLTYEEMATLLTQVEACLNSRPLSALPDDPADLAALTPGHFLIGSALNALPEPSLHDEQDNRLTRWQQLTKMRDQFWVRWKNEYLHGLTARSKWRRPMENLVVGRLCLITDEITPPSQWPLARVTEIHPGSDGKVRVAKVTTAVSEFTRPVHKLVVLPIDASDQ